MRANAPVSAAVFLCGGVSDQNAADIANRHEALIGAQRLRRLAADIQLAAAGVEHDEVGGIPRPLARRLDQEGLLDGAIPERVALCAVEIGG